MKRRLFTDRVTSLMTYLTAHLPESTYWCPEMMKMLVYLADWEATKKFGSPLTSLKWYRTGKKGLEAIGLEGVNNWEQYLPKRTILQKMKDTISRRKSFEDLSQNELDILETVIELKSSDNMRIGSFAFRSHIFATDPFHSQKANVVLEQPAQTFPNHRDENTPLLNTLEIQLES